MKHTLYQIILVSFLFFLCFCYNFLFAQNDTIIGKVKSVREETIYGKDEDEIARLKKEKLIKWSLLFSEN